MPSTDWKNHEIHQENACHQHDRCRGCDCELRWGSARRPQPSRRRPHRHRACPVCRSSSSSQPIRPPRLQLMQGFTSLLGSASRAGRSSRRTRDAASGRDSVGHPSAAPGSPSRRRGPAEHARHDGRAGGRAAEPAAVGYVVAGCLGVVDARRNTAGRSAADSGNRPGRRPQPHPPQPHPPQPPAAAAPAAAPARPRADADAAVRPAVTAAACARRQPQPRIWGNHVIDHGRRSPAPQPRSARRPHYCWAV